MASLPVWAGEIQEIMTEAAENTWEAEATEATEIAREAEATETIENARGIEATETIENMHEAEAAEMLEATEVEELLGLSSGIRKSAQKKDTGITDIPELQQGEAISILKFDVNKEPEEIMKDGFFGGRKVG